MGIALLIVLSIAIPVPLRYGLRLHQGWTSTGGSGESQFIAPLGDLARYKGFPFMYSLEYEESSEFFGATDRTNHLALAGDLGLLTLSVTGSTVALARRS